MKRNVKTLTAGLLILLMVMSSVFIFNVTAFAEDVSDQSADNVSSTSDEATRDEATLDEATADEATADENTYRYYFYLPKEWENEYSETAGIYWWEGTDACDSWPGYKANKTDIEGLFYYDVPTDVEYIIWNNYTDGVDPDTGFATTSTVFGLYGYDVGENPFYPDGLENFDNMVYVVDFSKDSFNEFALPYHFDGDWYYYYGSGEYGYTPEKTDFFFTRRSFGHVEYPVVVPEGTPSIGSGIRLYFIDAEKWEEVYVAYRYEATDFHNGTPGNKMKFERIDAQGNFVYSYRVPWFADSIVFSDGMDEITVQVTEDISYADKGYCVIMKQDGVWSLESFDYTNTDFEIGDTNLDGNVNVKDATAVQKHLASLATLNKVELGLADYNSDGDVNVKDATAIQKFIAGLV